MYSYEDVKAYIEEEDVKFIRLAFCDMYGNQKNAAIMPTELERAFNNGISFDASAIDSFGSAVESDMFLHPDPSTLTALPWRSINGGVIRMFCDIRHPDGRSFDKDCRNFLKETIKKAKQAGISCFFGAEFEFYLFKTDERGESTGEPLDNAGYMDIAPQDKGENIRREICFTLMNMGIQPEGSHHEEGPGQNKIDFRYSDALSSADNAVTFKSVVSSIAMCNGLFASFDPKPIKGRSGNGMHINISIKCDDGADRTDAFMAGILAHIKEITVFLNPTEESYKRFGEMRAPKYITWSPENRSQLIRIPAAKGENRRIELRSPDPCANPYIAYALLIYAGLDGIEKGMVPEKPVNLNLHCAPEEVVKDLETLPVSRKQASLIMGKSEWLGNILPEDYISLYK